VTSGPYALAVRAAAELARRTGVERHDAVVVLGSGWAGAAAAFGDPVAELDATELPGFLTPAAQGHTGRAISCRLGRRAVLVLQGRTHLYEGHGPAAVAHPIRTAAAAGARLAVLTSANGSLRPDWPTGIGVLLTDTLNLSACTPLVGPRFVDLTAAWSARLRVLARTVDPALVEGVYAMLRGPEYQTGAETALLRTIGADVVGMSTVLEAVAAREAGMELLGLSVVTTVEGGDSATDPAEVVAQAAAAATRLGAVVGAVLVRA
jgi:purine-nucleoside phosphorylase